MNPSTSPERKDVIKDGVKAVFKVGMGNPAIEDIFNGVGTRSKKMIEFKAKLKLRHKMTIEHTKSQ